MANHQITDLTIIGAGPTGLFAAFYAGLRGAKTKIVDSLEELGGAVTALYPEKYIYDVAGFPKVLGKDLIANQVEQTAAVNDTVCLGEKALKLERLEEHNLLRLTTDKREHFTRTLIIACGVGDIAKHILFDEHWSPWRKTSTTPPLYWLRPKALDTLLVWTSHPQARRPHSEMYREVVEGLRELNALPNGGASR